MKSFIVYSSWAIYDVRTEQFITDYKFPSTARFITTPNPVGKQNEMLFCYQMDSDDNMKMANAKTMQTVGGTEKLNLYNIVEKNGLVFGYGYVGVGDDSKHQYYKIVDDGKDGVLVTSISDSEYETLIAPSPTSVFK